MLIHIHQQFCDGYHFHYHCHYSFCYCFICTQLTGLLWNYMVICSFVPYSDNSLFLATSNLRCSAGSETHTQMGDSSPPRSPYTWAAAACTFPAPSHSSLSPSHTLSTCRSIVCSVPPSPRYPSSIYRSAASPNRTPYSMLTSTQIATTDGHSISTAFLSSHIFIVSLLNASSIAI